MHPVHQPPKIAKKMSPLFHIYSLGAMNFMGALHVEKTSVLTKASVWYKIGILWINITHVKSQPMALGFYFLADMNQIF